MIWHGNAEAQNAVSGFNGDVDILLRVSHDAGRTWEDRLTVSDETLKVNQYEPGIAVGPDGVVHMAWYDFRNSPTNPIASTSHSGDVGISDVYYASSSDHGSTFAPPIRVNDRGIDRSKGVWSNNIDSKFNVGVAVNNDNVFFARQDTRNALGETGSEDIYTSSVPLRPVTVNEADSGIPGCAAADGPVRPRARHRCRLAADPSSGRRVRRRPWRHPLPGLTPRTRLTPWAGGPSGGACRWPRRDGRRRWRRPCRRQPHPAGRR